MFALVSAALIGLAAREAAAQTPAAPNDQPPAPPPAPAPAPNAPTDGQSADEMEKDVFGSEPAPPPRPAPPAVQPPPVPPPPLPARRRPRPVQQTDAEANATAGAAATDQPGFAIELSTSGFASGALQGGVFIGGRTGGDLLIGGILNFSSSSQNVTVGSVKTETSASSLLIGVGMRMTFLRAADRHVDLFGAADAGVVYTSSKDTNADVSTSLFGGTIAAGPGLRFWVNDNIAVGYVARVRLTYASGTVDSASNPGSGGDMSSTDFAIEGSFQLLGVF
jgi:hypothetical protein